MVRLAGLIFTLLTSAVQLAFAIPQITNSNYDISEGKPFMITWTGAQGSVTIALMTGTSANLRAVVTIASSITGNSFTWTPSGIPSGTYALRIQDSSGPNFSQQFAYSGSGSLVTSASPASATSSAVSSPRPTPSASSSTPPPNTSTPTDKPGSSTSSPPATGPTDSSSSSSSPGAESQTSGSGSNPSSPPSPDSSSGNNNNNNNNNNGGSDGGLSTGTKAGIGVGAGLGGLIILGGLAFFIYRKGKAAGSRGQGNGGGGFETAELGGEPKAKPELGGQQVHQMYTQDNVAEMGGPYYDVGPDEYQVQPVEMDGYGYRGVHPVVEKG